MKRDLLRSHQFSTSHRSTHTGRPKSKRRALNSAKSRGVRNKAGSKAREDNYGDVYVLEVCGERGGQQAWLFLPQPAVKSTSDGPRYC